MNKSKIDPFAGVVKADVLKEHIRGLINGKRESFSYIRGSLQYLERHPPNKYIVPLLKRAQEKAHEAMVLRS